MWGQKRGKASATERPSGDENAPDFVMAGLVHALLSRSARKKTWMPGIKPGMTGVVGDNGLQRCPS
jgi:hypothetical protein